MLRKTNMKSFETLGDETLSTVTGGTTTTAAAETTTTSSTGPAVPRAAAARDCSPAS